MCSEEPVFGERERERGGCGEGGGIIVRNLLGEYSSLWEESLTLFLFLACRAIELTEFLN